MPDFSLRGVSDLQRRIKDISSQARSNLSDAAMEEAESIVTEAKERYVPVREGKLRDSIRATKGHLSQGRDEGGRFTSGSEIEIVISAGGDDIPYAVTIHEHPSPHDPPTWDGVSVQFNPPGTGPKFLELPLNSSIQGMADRVGSKVLK